MEDAKALSAAGKHQEAGELFFAIAKSDPANIGAWDGAIASFCQREARVGRCMDVLDLELQVLGNLERHKDALGQALEIRARARLEQGLTDAALSDLERSARAAPGRAVTLILRARAHLMKGEHEAALQTLYKAKKIDPNNNEADEVFQMIPREVEGSAPAVEDSFGGAP